MGVAINEFRIGLSTIYASNKLPEQLLDDHIALLLSVLPRGTKHVQSVEKPIVSTTKDIDLHFEHPFFDALPGHQDAVTRLETKHCRVAWKNADGTIGQDALFLGIQYLTADSKERFST